MTLSTGGERSWQYKSSTPTPLDNHPNLSYSVNKTGNRAKSPANYNPTRNLTMQAFNTLLQALVTGDTSEFDIDTIEMAIEVVSTAQFDVNTKRVETLVKAILKDGAMWVAPTIAVLDDVYHLVSGRHRFEAARYICDNYRINNAGKMVQVNWENPAIYQDFEIIDFVLDCNVVTVPDKAALNAFIIAANGSRSMTAAEKATANLDAGKASALTTKKLRWSQELRSKLSGVVTQQTALQFAGCLFSTKGQTPRAQHATPEQLITVATEFAAWYASVHQSEGFPTNVARNVTTIWDTFLPSIIESFNAAIPTVVVAPKKERAATRAQQTIAELQAQLQQLMAERGAL